MTSHPGNALITPGVSMHLTTALARLLALANDDPDRACAELDLLVAWHGREAMAQALQHVAGDELTTLGLA